MKKHTAMTLLILFCASIVALLSAYAGWADEARCRTCGKLLMKGTKHICKRRKPNEDRKREKAQCENLRKVLKVSGFCGHNFGEANTNESDTVLLKKGKRYFGGYDKLTLKYSKSAGLYSITAENNDSFAIKDVESEINRMSGIFEKKLRCTFAGEISSRNNAQYGERAVSQAVCDSITGGIKGYTRGYQAVLVRPATETYYHRKEDFQNVTITLQGTLNHVSNSKTVRCTIELKNQ